MSGPTSWKASAGAFRQHSPGGMGRPCGHGRGVAQQHADLLVQPVLDDVLELAGVGVHLVLAHAQHVAEQALGQAVAAHDAAGRLEPGR